MKIHSNGNGSLGVLVLPSAVGCEEEVIYIVGKRILCEVDLMLLREAIVALLSTFY